MDVKRIEEKWGRGSLGRVAKFLTDEPQSTIAWAKGADGERRLARRLDDALVGEACLLHDRAIPRTRANIDHVVIAASGVWVIDAKNYTGLVERRDVGGWRRVDDHLFVNGRDRTNLAAAMDRQVAAVASVLQASHVAGVPLHPVLCFTNADWRLFAKPFDLHGVMITWASKLIDAISAPGTLDERTIKAIGSYLADNLKPAAARVPD